MSHIQRYFSSLNAEKSLSYKLEMFIIIINLLKKVIIDATQESSYTLRGKRLNHGTRKKETYRHKKNFQQWDAGWDEMRWAIKSNASLTSTQSEFLIP